ncbi:MAG: putative transcriptional regulator [Oleiphilaceae bacterium]|jgi:putative transcriptional regulator
MANYHPSDELLMSFSAGQMPNALGIIVACHLEKCSHCRQRAALYERIGGEILMDTDDAPMPTQLLDNLLSKLELPEISATNESHAISVLDSFADSERQMIQNLPRPLRRFVGNEFNKLPWTGMTSSLKEFVLSFSDNDYTAKFYKISAGKELPEHTHRGNEYTLVLDGSFSDKAGEYHQGDFILADKRTIHQPKAANDCDCICFAVTDAPLKMTGLFGRMLNPFLK